MSEEGKKMKFKTFSCLSLLQSKTSIRPEQTLRAVDNPLFPPACHLLLIYTA